MPYPIWWKRRHELGTQGDPHEDAYVWVTPARQGGEPCVGGTRIPTSIIANICEPHEDAETIDSVCRMYNLTRPQVICALWWEHGRGDYRFDRRTKRGRWLSAAHSHLARLGKADDPGEFV